MPNADSTQLQQLIRRVLRWIRRSLGLRHPQRLGTLEGVSDRATLWRVPNEEPGVAVCWWICHQDASADLVITLINLAQLSADAGQRRLYRRATDPICITSQRRFSAQLNDYCQDQGGLDARFVSHIFVVAWRSRIPSGDRRSYLVRPLAAIPGDLQGVTNAWSSGDRYAIKITEMIARRLLRTEGSSLNSWQDIIEGIDWLEWLEFYSQCALGKSHTLQPRRYRG